MIAASQGSVSENLSVLHEARPIRDAIIQQHGVRIGFVREPMYARAAERSRLLVDGLDELAANAAPAQVAGDEQVLQIAIVTRGPARAVIDPMDDPGELAGFVHRNEAAHRLTPAGEAREAISPSEERHAKVSHAYVGVSVRGC